MGTCLKYIGGGGQSGRQALGPANLAFHQTCHEYLGGGEHRQGGNGRQPPPLRRQRLREVPLGPQGLRGPQGPQETADLAGLSGPQGPQLLQQIQQQLSSLVQRILWKKSW